MYECNKLKVLSVDSVCFHDLSMYSFYFGLRVNFTVTLKRFSRRDERIVCVLVFVFGVVYTYSLMPKLGILFKAN